MMRFIFGCVALLWFSTTAIGEEFARMRYSTALQITGIEMKNIEGVAPTSMRFFVRSITPGVCSDDIQMALESKNGDLDITVDAEGNFDLPISKELQEEDPWLIANQPKGSLRMEFAYAFDLDITPQWIDQAWQVSYRSVFPYDAVRNRMEATIRKVNENHAVNFNYTESRGALFANPNPLAHLRVKVDGKDVELSALMDGEFPVPYDAEWWEADARICVSPPFGWSVDIDQVSKHEEMQAGKLPTLIPPSINEVQQD
ncbi:hypothetical protein [Rhodopirellula baltica]|uniref:Uncharacterized protein n=1 Tax=Rhodopirellula baltica SWK14 TaxID=993516 RepID=L7C7U5_RHOBT|nr:hypothetical protein [Rhodopirellula baltica]ELP29885.1 hypothetical protein RBSWK_06174 [Rhodopirellula baltica SWK14]